jgi:quinol monooxygenase YgiN
MSENRLRVLARVSAKASSVEQVRTILIGLVEATRKEPGCLSYQFLQNRSDPNDFVSVEEWESAAAEQAHFSTVHLKDALVKLAGHLAAEPDIRRYSVLR